MGRSPRNGQSGHSLRGCASGRKKSRYLRSGKSPYILVIDASRATSEGRHAFPASLNGATLSDGDPPETRRGVTESKYINALYHSSRHGGGLKFWST